MAYLTKEDINFKRLRYWEVHSRIWLWIIGNLPQVLRYHK